MRGPSFPESTCRISWARRELANQQRAQTDGLTSRPLRLGIHRAEGTRQFRRFPVCAQRRVDVSVQLYSSINVGTHESAAVSACFPCLSAFLCVHCKHFVPERGCLGRLRRGRIVRGVCSMTPRPSRLHQYPCRTSTHAGRATYYTITRGQHHACLIGPVATTVRACEGSDGQGVPLDSKPQYTALWRARLSCTSMKSARTPSSTCAYCGRSTFHHGGVSGAPPGRSSLTGQPLLVLPLRRGRCASVFDACDSLRVPLRAGYVTYLCPLISHRRPKHVPGIGPPLWSLDLASRRPSIRLSVAASR